TITRYLTCAISRDRHDLYAYIAFARADIDDVEGPLKESRPVLTHRATTSVWSLPRDTSSTATGSNFGEEGLEVVPISFVSFRYQHTKEGSRGFLYAKRPANVARGG